MDQKNNTGNRNTGDRNTGDGNTGDGNTGDGNTGDRNTGYRNTGNRNTGDRNTGYRNTGYRNTGDRNTGNRNTGDGNTGYRNTGDRNTGDGNTGYRNTGDRNTGNRNTGNRNTGNRNTGYLNTVSPKDGYLFNKIVSNLFDDDGDCIIEFPNWFNFDLISSNGTDNPCLWIPELQMTEEEKKENETYKTTEGYIKVGVVDKDMKTHWRKAFDNCNDLGDLRKTLELPNFDYQIFEEISGISKADFDKKLGVSENIIGKEINITIDGRQYMAIIKQ